MRRACGFPDPGSDAAAFSEADVETFVAADAGAGCAILLRLLDALAADEVLPQLVAGSPGLSVAVPLFNVRRAEPPVGGLALRGGRISG